MRGVRRVLAVLATLAVLAPGAWLAGGPAWATCPAQPVRSTASFVGKVDRVGPGGYEAFVTTADNREVVVDGQGGPAGDGPRTFLAGETYEFHPLNGASPYKDSACTATHPVGDSLWSAETVVILAIIVGMVLSAPRIARWIRRRWGPPPHDVESDAGPTPPGEPTASA